MKKKEDSFSSSQIRGLELGFEMLNEGDKLFNQLAKEDQQRFSLLNYRNRKRYARL